MKQPPWSIARLADDGQGTLGAARSPRQVLAQTTGQTAVVPTK